MWYLTEKKRAVYTLLYGQHSAQKQNIHWWLNLLGVIPITLAAIILAIVAIAAITATFSMLATGWYWFLAFIFIGAILGQSASTRNSFSTMISTLFTDGLFHHLKLHVLKRGLKKDHSNKIKALLDKHREYIQNLQKEKNSENTVEKQLHTYLYELETEHDDVLLHQLLTTYLNNDKDNKAIDTQKLIRALLERPINDILDDPAVKKELLVKKILLLIFGGLVTLTAIGYSTIIFTHIFGVLATFFATNTLLIALGAGSAAGLVAVIFGFGLYFQFHQATQRNLFKHLFYTIKDIFHPQYILVTANEWNQRLSKPSKTKEKSIIIGLSLFHLGKILALTCIFGGLLAITILVSLFTAGASLNASVSTMNFILLGLNITTPVSLTIAQWLAVINVFVIVLTSTLFGYLSASQFIAYAATLIRNTVVNGLALREQFIKRINEYKIQRWLILGDIAVGILFGFVFTSYLAFELVKMAIPLEASHNPNTQAIPSFVILCTLFLAITQTMNQLLTLLGLENEHGSVNRSLKEAKKSWHHIIANCQVQWDHCFHDHTLSKAYGKSSQDTYKVCQELEIKSLNFTGSQKNYVVETSKSPYTYTLFKKNILQKEPSSFTPQNNATPTLITSTCK